MTYITALMGFFVYGSGIVGVAQTTTPAVLLESAPLHTREVFEITPQASHKELTVSMTGYNALPEQTDDTPHITGSGAFSNPELIAARSADLRDELPYGTIIKITGEPIDNNNCNYEEVKPFIGYRIIADGMNPRIHNTIDILLDHTDNVQIGTRSLNPAKALGKCHEVTITVLGHVDIKNIPETQSELRALVEGQFLAFNQ